MKKVVMDFIKRGSESDFREFDLEKLFRISIGPLKQSERHGNRL